MKGTREERLYAKLPEWVHPFLDVALTANPKLLLDMEKILCTHSCKGDEVYNTVEHLVALVASEQPGKDRWYLRQKAFDGKAIDGGQKTFEMAAISEVRLGTSHPGYDISLHGSFSFWLDLLPDGYRPLVGDVCWQYTIGTSFFAVVIAGHVAYYETYEQRYDRYQAELEQRRSEARLEFPERDTRIANLPEEFQERFKKFQRAPFFREDLEGYELYVCEQAVAIAKRLKTAQKLKHWCRLNSEHQRAFMPELDDDHTGNTMYMACGMAYIYLTEPEKIVKVHGSAAMLTGSDVYLPPEERQFEKAA